MKQFIVKKIILFIVSLWIVATLTFILMHSIPGDPLMQEQAAPEEVMDAMYAHYGLDQPILTQYVNYLKNLLKLDFGPSFIHEGRSVNQIIADGLPISAAIGSIALVVSLFSGVLIGMIAGIYPGKWQDHLSMLFGLIGISIPSFLIATLLQFIFGIQLGVLPVARWGSFAHAILPSLSLSFLPTAFIARLTRANVVEIMQEDYIECARCKGLSKWQIVRKHVLKNALIPVITYVGHISGSILTGSFIIEKIFAIPGLGYWFVVSIVNRDYTAIMGITIFYSALLMSCVFITDIIHTLLDPRIKLLKQEMQYG